MRFNFHLMTIALMALFSSCGIPQEPTPNVTYTNLADFHNTHGVPIHTFILDAGTGGTFTTPKGTVVTIPANAFYVIGGLATGPVKFEMRDIYDKSDMILSNITTQSNGQPIISGGEAWFRFTQGGNPLYLNPSNPVTVKMPRDPGAAPMQLYSGIQTPTGNVNWVTEDTIPPISIQGDTMVFELDNAVYSATLSGNWVNCDHAFGAYTPTNLTVNVPMDFLPVSSFLVFDEYNTVVSLYTISGAFTYNYAPLGHNCTLVSVAIKDGKLYTLTKSLTITTNQSVNVNLSETDPEAFASQLENLN